MACPPVPPPPLPPWLLPKEPLNEYAKALMELDAEFPGLEQYSIKEE